MKNIIRIIILIIIMFLCCIDCHAEEKTNLQLVKETCKAKYHNSNIKFVIGCSEKTENIIFNRKNKNYIVVEIMVSKSCGNYGYTKEGFYIVYNKTVPKNEFVTSYCVYNPYTNYCDDVVYVIENQTIR